MRVSGTLVEQARALFGQVLRKKYAMTQIYVALDLEMTGLDTDEDEIIEVGAVKFRSDEVLETFSQLVKPRRPLPLKITRLTGITVEELLHAPGFNDIAPDIVRFIKHYPIIGHSVDNDIEMLRMQGVHFAQPVYDTFHLSAMLLPGMPAYKLGTLADTLGISHPELHRALHDADVTRQVFLYLLERIKSFDLQALSEMNSLMDLALWSFGDLFAEITREKARTAFTDPAPTHQTSPGPGRIPRLHGASRPGTSGTEPAFSFWDEDKDEPASARYSSGSEQPLKPTGVTRPLEQAEVDAYFEPGGPISLILPTYEKRESQIRMAHAITETLNNASTILVEAGTGTGKSMAYLVPAALFAIQRGERVVVSTNTINLQDQLFFKDIPDVQRLMAGDADAVRQPFTAALLKGRSNYLCLRRYYQLRREETMPPEEARVLLKVQCWLQSTTSGDSAELMLADRERIAWNRINVPVDTCTGSSCPDFHECFFFKARRKAEMVHLVVVNHALLLADLVSQSRVLPPYDHVVIDEAHNLEDVATDQFSFSLDQESLRQYLDMLYQVGGGQSHPIGGILSELPASVRLGMVEQQGIDMVDHMCQSLYPSIERARDAVGEFFDGLAGFVRRETEAQNGGGGGSGEYDLRMRITPAIRQKSIWSGVEHTWDNLNLSLTHIGDGLGKLETVFLELEHAEIPDYEELLLRIQSLKRAFTDVRVQTGHIISGDENNIYWINQRHTTNVLTLKTAPLKVADMLQAQLFAQKQTAILTSATLSINDSLAFIKDRLGVFDAEELLLESPFDYERQALIYIPNDIPEPNQRGYQQKLEEALIELCTATSGRTLALFTANSALKRTFQGIQEALEDQDIIVLGQGVDGSRRTILERFKECSRTVLLGTSSFWEGVDVVGDALSVLVIAKLPFSVPSDPIFAARSEQFSDPFSQYMIPQSILRFKQGFGRLIRSTTDRGIAVVLDRRLLSKKYGLLFLQSLPSTTVREGPLKQLPRMAARFLE